MNDSIHNNQIQFLQPSSKQNKSNTMQTFFCFLVFFNQQKPNNVVLQRGRPEKSIFSDYCKSHVHKMASTRGFSYFQGNFIRHSCHLFWLTSSTFPWWLTVNFTRQRASIRRPSLFFVSVLQHSKVMIRKPEATHVHSLKKTESADDPDFHLSRALTYWHTSNTAPFRQQRRLRCLEFLFHFLPTNSVEIHVE